MKRFLFVGLGNVGAKYQHTRHNVGFHIADEVAQFLDCTFTDSRFAAVAEATYKGKQLTIIKPTTLMNRSGQAVSYYINQLDIPRSQSLTFVDDLALPFGKIRMKGKGSSAGHNGLKDIEQWLGSQSYPRLRFGIGNNFSRGQQIEYVLGQWNDKEQEELASYLNEARQAALHFVHHGLANTMNEFN